MTRRIDLEAALALRAQGKTYREIGEQFGVSPQAANALLLAHGADRTYGLEIKSRRLSRRERNEAIRALYPQLTQERLAKRFGVSRSRVSVIVRGSG